MKNNKISQIGKLSSRNRELRVNNNRSQPEILNKSLQYCKKINKNSLVLNLYVSDQTFGLFSSGLFCGLIYSSNILLLLAIVDLNYNSNIYSLQCFLLLLNLNRKRQSKVLVFVSTL